MKCAICGYVWKISEKCHDLYPYKICENCALIGPNEPVNFTVPKGNIIPSFLKDKESIIVSKEEMHRLYDDYYNLLSNVSKYLKKIMEQTQKLGNVIAFLLMLCMRNNQDYIHTRDIGFNYTFSVE